MRISADKKKEKRIVNLNFFQDRENEENSIDAPDSVPSPAFQKSSGFGKSRSKVSFAFRSGQITAKRIRRGLSSRERLNSSGRGGGRGAGRVEKGKNVDEET